MTCKRNWEGASPCRNIVEFFEERSHELHSALDNNTSHVESLREKSHCAVAMTTIVFIMVCPLKKFTKHMRLSQDSISSIHEDCFEYTTHCPHRLTRSNNSKNKSSTIERTSITNEP